MSTNARSKPAEQLDQQVKSKSWLLEVFKLNPSGIHWGRAVMVLDLVLVPLVVLAAIGEEQYLISAVFGVLFAAIVDPGGSYGYRSLGIAAFALAGAAVTALGFGIATSGWGWIVLAAFAVTLLAGLAVKFGLHRFVAGLLLNIWFFVAVALGSSQHSGRLTSYTWAQVLAWVGGAALWIALTFIAWLIQGRKDLPPALSELPGDTEPRKLTPPLVTYAVLRAVGMAGATAIAFGAHLAHADWTPIAAIIAMKPSLDQTKVVATQRIAGALIGAAVAALLLLVLASEHGLRQIAVGNAFEVVVIILFMHAAGIRFWNYALYTAAVAAGVLLASGLPKPSNHTAQVERVLWTLIGVAIAVLVMLVGDSLSRVAAAKAKTQPQAA